jgi:hypothetical protein
LTHEIELTVQRYPELRSNLGHAVVVAHATATSLGCPDRVTADRTMPADPAVEAFVVAQGDRRMRGAFRLAGVIVTLCLAFALTIDSLQVFHDGAYLLYPLPFVAFALVGELAVAMRRLVRPRNPRIPQAWVRVRCERGRASRRGELTPPQRARSAPRAC